VVPGVSSPHSARTHNPRARRLSRSPLYCAGPQYLDRHLQHQPPCRTPGPDSAGHGRLAIFLRYIRHRRRWSMTRVEINLAAITTSCAMCAEVESMPPRSLVRAIMSRPTGHAPATRGLPRANPRNVLTRPHGSPSPSPPGGSKTQHPGHPFPAACPRMAAHRHSSRRPRRLILRQPPGVQPATSV